MLIRRVFGGFHLFHFADVDTRLGKSGLKKQCVSGKDTWRGTQLLSRHHRARLLRALMRTRPSRPSPQRKECELLRLQSAIELSSPGACWDAGHPATDSWDIMGIPGSSIASSMKPLTHYKAGVVTNC